MKKSDFAFLVSFIVVSSLTVIFIIGSLCGLMYKYISCGILCDEIQAGHEIDTKISNGNTAPMWFDEIASILQMQGPRIPLVEACYYRNVQAVGVLLSNGADPNIFLSGRFSPLEAAIVNGPVDEDSLAIIKMLLEYGADPDKFGSEAPLIIKLSTFVYYGNENPLVEDIIMLLLENGANCHWDNYNKVAFLIVSGGNASLVSKYFAYSSDSINDIDDDGQNLLMQAIKYNKTSSLKDVVDILLQYGIDIHYVDSSGLTSYDYAIERNYTEIAELLKP